ncbi:biotin carboxyl carrier domain-containing protein [Amylibacter sp.]|jgi:biotin carboxyl carrier protein|nr:biotin carboxyl carrier domain-containing protein [Amylibacter sp.]MDC1499477.1 biotin carboxyl carrier domain-containing protein [Amylibacter sp.]
MKTKMCAPLPGIFYRKNSPDEPPFFEDGDIIVPGSIIGLVETMKSFFPITSDVSGKINFLVENGSIVDADEPIAEIG